jgi:ribosome biogenesis protein MAK21
MGKDSTPAPRLNRPLLSQAKQAYQHQVEKATSLLTKDKALSREMTMLEDMQKDGTLVDKMTSLMLKVQRTYEVGIACDIVSLDKLITSAKKKNRREAIAALDALKELFLQTLLPDHELEYVLKKSEAPSKDKELAKLYLEDKIKHKYSEFLEILEKHTMDTVEHHKKTAIRMLAELARSKPEARQRILSAMVNKLGDTTASIPTAVILEANSIVRRVREVMVTLIKTVGNFVFRKHLPIKAKFYCVVLLNSIKLKPGDQESIKLVISIYLKLFPSILEQASEDHNKTIALLLQAINKVFPLYAQKKQVYSDFFSQEIQNLYRLTHHYDNFNIQIHALRFIFQVERAEGMVSDRFYKALYDHLLPSNRLQTVNTKALHLFFHTLMLALKEDSNISRVRAFIKRLFQGCTISEPNYICACLLLLHELCKVHNSLHTIFSSDIPMDEEEVYEDIPDSDEETTEKKQPEENAHTDIHNTDSQFDPLKRDPKYARGENAHLGELTLLLSHYHPTVSKWAKAVINRDDIEYSSDPLLDFSLMNFLDRFSFRNPKQSVVEKLRGKRVRSALMQESVNSKSFRDADYDSIPEEEKFYHKYFKLQKPNEGSEGSDSEGSAHESLDEQWEAMDGLDFADLPDEEEEPESKPKKKRKTFASAEDYDELIS